MLPVDLADLYLDSSSAWMTAAACAALDHTE